MLIRTLLLPLFCLPVFAVGAHAVDSSLADRLANRRSVTPSDSALLYHVGPVWTSPHHTIGFTQAQMENYGPDPYLLRTVRLLFGSAASIPRYGATIASGALQSADVASLIRLAYSTTDVSAGRFLPLADDSSVVDALARERRDGAWNTLPFALREFLARLERGASDALPYFAKAYSRGALASTWRNADTMLRLARAPWTDERESQYAMRDRRGLDMLLEVDRASMAFASVVWAAHVDRAIQKLLSEPIEGNRSFAQPYILQIQNLGSVHIYGNQADTIDGGGAAIVIDLGGNDLWVGRTATALGWQRPLALALDLGGNDAYMSVDDTMAVAAACGGMAMLVDVEGDDRYVVKSQGLSAAWYGTSVLVDYSGNDSYEVSSTYGQAAATVGVAILDDRGGNDRYQCGAEAQAYAQTFGCGLLVDRTGNDLYVARADGAPSELYMGQSVSRSQGAAFGRRADLGDGHSLSGGVAALVDGEGDDSYSASAWSQGCGYWWSAGFLEDLAGNDRYWNGKYAWGAAAHFAVGCAVDAAGNDAYNVDNDDAVNQYHGHARDGSIGVAIDGNGNDMYELRSHCGGSGDLGSIGLFIDTEGDDHYNLIYNEPEVASGWLDTPPLGSATRYEVFHTWRDDVMSLGCFVDGGGADTYRWNLNDETGSKHASNNLRRVSKRSSNSLGVFVDK